MARRGLISRVVKGAFGEVAQRAKGALDAVEKRLLPMSKPERLSAEPPKALRPASSPVAPRASPVGERQNESGRKTRPAAAAKRKVAKSKRALGFKVKRGQKHLHSRR